MPHPLTECSQTSPHFICLLPTLSSLPKETIRFQSRHTKAERSRQLLVRRPGRLAIGPVRRPHRVSRREPAAVAEQPDQLPRPEVRRRCDLVARRGEARHPDARVHAQLPNQQQTRQTTGAESEAEHSRHGHQSPRRLRLHYYSFIQELEP